MQAAPEKVWLHAQGTRQKNCCLAAVGRLATTCSMATSRFENVAKRASSIRGGVLALVIGVPRILRHRREGSKEVRPCKGVAALPAFVPKNKGRVAESSIFSWERNSEKIFFVRGIRLLVVRPAVRFAS